MITLFFEGDGEGILGFFLWFGERLLVWKGKRSEFYD